MSSLSGSEVTARQQQCTLANLRFSLAGLAILYLSGLFYYGDTRDWRGLIS